MDDPAHLGLTKIPPFDHKTESAQQPWRALNDPKKQPSDNYSFLRRLPLAFQSPTNAYTTPSSLRALIPSFEKSNSVRRHGRARHR
jgi:hypothetical protein